MSMGGTLLDLAVLTAELVEAEANDGGVLVMGAGMEQAVDNGARMRGTLAPGTPVALSGTAHPLDPELQTGVLVVATELRTTDGTPTSPLPAAVLVARDLRRLGLDVRTGPLVFSSSAPLAEEA